MITLPFRSVTLTLAILAGGGLVSCTTDTGPDDNIFLRENAPRYGHGGTETPRYKYGATETGATSRGETQYLDQRKPRESQSSETTTNERPSASEAADAGGGQPAESGQTTEAPPRTVEPPETTGPEPAVAETKPKPAADDTPYATPVPGKEGMVYSPFHNGGYVDVSGIPSGQKMRCPYTKKVFRVP
jgi:hypothetical protein